jgi:hypothetical protein
MTDQCRLCGSVHHRWERHVWAAPEAPRSNSRSPSLRTQDRDRTQPAKDLSAQETAPSRDKPDTAPSIRNLPDDQLKPYHNEWMRRQMMKRRAKQKDQ